MKKYNIQYGIGHAKYVVNFHDGTKFYNDGSNFYDIRIFKNKKELNQFVKGLINNGFEETSLMPF